MPCHQLVTPSYFFDPKGPASLIIFLIDLSNQGSRLCPVGQVGQLADLPGIYRLFADQQDCLNPVHLRYWVGSLKGIRWPFPVRPGQEETFEFSIFQLKSGCQRNSGNRMGLSQDL